MGWVSTYEMVHGKRVGDDDINEGPKPPSTEPLAFATFANACVVPKKTDSPTARDNRQLEVYFSDSSKTRRDVLVHIFKPLLGDIFAYNVVNSVFQALGILDDSEYLLKVGLRRNLLVCLLRDFKLTFPFLKCFGEWYMTLPSKEAAQKGFYSLYSPMMRWLQEMVTKQLETKTAEQDEVPLQSLHKFCSESADLVKAFMLGALCREAVAKAAIKTEEKTYGKILSSEMGE